MNTKRKIKKSWVLNFINIANYVICFPIWEYMEKRVTGKGFLAFEFKSSIEDEFLL